jgi:putative inorganic carbon (hco3(-)) transporter
MIYYALLLFFVVEYLRPAMFVPALGILRLNSFVPLFCFFATMVGKSPVSNRQFMEETSTKLMGIMLGLMIVSTAFATVTMTAFTVTRNVFAYMLLYWVLVRHLGDVRRIKGVFGTLILVHIALAALSPAMFRETTSRSGLNAGGFLGDGNDFSLSVNICVPFCVFLLLETKNKLAKFVWIVSLGVLIFSIVATKSRGGTLAIAAVGLYLWIRSERKLMAAAVTMLAVLVVLATAPALWFERMGTMADPEESSAQGRILAWKQGVQMALHNPLLGVGPGQFPMAFGNASAGRWTTAHSIYFLLLGELGFPGIIVLVSFIVTNLLANQRMLHVLGKAPRDQLTTTSTNLVECTSASLIAYAVGGAFLSAAYYPHMYVLCGLHAASRRIIRTKLEAREHAGQDHPALESVAARPPVRHDAISPEWQPRRSF